MVEYISRFFDVEVQPPPRNETRGKVDTGTIVIGDNFKLWKHAVPMYNAFRFPSQGNSGGPLVVVLMVRELCSWLVSLSDHAYDLFPASGCRRKQGKVAWMLGNVEVRDQGSADPIHGGRFSSAVELWATYVIGYLSKDITDLRSDTPVLVVCRSEDLIRRPKKVMEELEKIGLPRKNNVEFQPIEERIRHGRPVAGENRAQLVRRESALQLQPFVEQRCLEELEQQVKPYAGLFRWLGYPQPKKGPGRRRPEAEGLPAQKKQKCGTRKGRASKS